MSVTWSPKYLSFPPLQRPVQWNSLLPETRCPLLPGHLRLQFSTLLSKSCSSFFSVLSRSSSSDGGVNANVLRTLTRPRLHAGPGRAPSALLRASDLEKPTAEDCKVGAGQRGLPQTDTPFPGQGMRPPRGSHGWEGGPARAPRATEGTRSVPGPLRHPRPGKGPPAHRPLPALERKVPASARAGARKRRGSGSRADSVRRRTLTRISPEPSQHRK